MGQKVEYKFKIDAFTRETIPMWRLAEYLTAWAAIMGERDHVHFERVEEGSAMPVAWVEWEAAPKIDQRINEVRNNEGPEEARRGVETINRKLAEDNATGEILGPRGRVLQFAGRKRSAQTTYGPFNQPGSLDGVVARIGGETADVDPVPVHIQEGNALYICRADHDVVRRLAPYLLERDKPIRVTGVGRWFRNAKGEWDMRSFTIQDFEPLRKTTLSEVVKRLRQIPSNWSAKDIASMRSDPTESES